MALLNIPKGGQRLEWAQLGPCPCQGCGILLYWDGLRWCMVNGKRHLCAKAKAA